MEKWHAYLDDPTVADAILDRLIHNAYRIKLDGDTLSVFYSRAHDCPEHILLSQIELTPDWMNWQDSEPVSVLKPEAACEGAGLPVLPSERGAIHEPACQLRDPAVYREGDRTYLLYSVAGEQGIGMAEIVE